MTRDNHYIDGDRFTELAADGQPTEELIEMFYLLATRTFWTHPVRRYVELADAKQEAAIRCLSLIDRFGHRVRGPAYNYFRSVIHHLFCDIVRVAKREVHTGPIEDHAEDYRPALMEKFKR